MVEKKTVITNSAGIHCRPSSVILSEIQNYPDHNFKINCTAGESDLSSILSLLSLGIQCNEEVTISVEGSNEEEICQKIADLFAFEFDFK